MNKQILKKSYEFLFDDDKVTSEIKAAKNKKKYFYHMIRDGEIKENDVVIKLK